MPELDDHRLLAEFARSGSEAAFTELVNRHAGLVFSTAFRFCNNPHHAEEIAQAVFIILATFFNILLNITEYLSHFPVIYSRA